jgi:hypothetical protein
LLKDGWLANGEEVALQKYSENTRRLRKYLPIRQYDAPLCVFFITTTFTAR